MFLLLSLVAEATEVLPIPVFTEGATRAVKVDIFSFGQALHPYGTDWTPTTIEQWSAVLECELQANRREQCIFHSGEVWWGYVLEGSEQMVTHHIPMAGTFELSWSPTGRLASWDVLGDRSAFHERASNAMLDTYHRQDVVWKPDSQRKIGADMEQALLRGFAAVLELELPKKGRTKEGAWKSSAPPSAGRRYSQGAATGQVEYALKIVEGSYPHVSMVGRVSEASPIGGSVSSYAVEAKVLGEYDLDPESWTLLRGRVEAAHGSTSTNLVGHTRFLGMVEQYTAGASTEPASFPKPWIE